MMNKEAILQVTDRGLSVFRHYLSVRFRVGKKFLNPLYKDTKASCNIYYDQKHAIYKMKDFGNDEYSGDCFELVGKMTGLSCRQPKEFVEIMRIIDQDLHLGLADGYETAYTPSPVQTGFRMTPEQKEKTSVRTALYHARGTMRTRPSGANPALRKRCWANIMWFPCTHSVR